MAYDEELAERTRRALARPELESDLTEKKMFGGLAFLINGNMACGIVRDEMMIRVGPEHHDEALAQPYARPMDFTGRPLKGFVYVDSQGTETDDALTGWIERGVEFARTLPAKR
ncbi:MAG: TfoX/Sxy family protein [Myxococcales bacterium]|nr:TfoX/Sxy family protein [Myxococcales bacterium]MCB9748940.1 TfoX/Sxy family protein [Myxococcales bacterium]